MLALCLYCLLASCGVPTQIPGETEDNHQETSSETNTLPAETEKEEPDPIFVKCEDVEYTSYVLPVKEDGDGTILEEKGDFYASDGVAHLRVYDYTGLTAGDKMQPKLLYRFTDFIFLEHGEYETPYIFRGGKDLKIIIGTPEEITYHWYYVTSPAVFGAFEDIIASLDFFETSEKRSPVPSMIYVGFEYDGQKYYVFRDGTVWRGNKKSPETLSEEQYALFAAYKYAYYYAATNRVDNFSGFTNDSEENNTVVIIEGGQRRSLIGDEAFEFLKRYAPFPDEMGRYAVSLNYRCDVNPSNNLGEPALRFAICKEDEEIDDDHLVWYSVFGDGTVTRRGRWKLEQEYRNNIIEEFCVPLLQISIDAAD